MSSYDIAEKIRESLPGTEEILVQYLSGYLVDDASDDEDILQVARYILESLAMDKPDVLEQLMDSLTTLLQDQLIRREKIRSGPKLQRLDKVLDMSKTGAMSNTIAFAEGVDLESINKGKCVSHICYPAAMCLTCRAERASRVDVKKLEKQEAKLKAKIEKRARRDLYEGSKLLEQTKKQVRLHTLPFLAYRRRYMLQAILRRDVHESALYTRFSAGTSQSWDTLDQPFTICSLEEQEQGYPPPLHRCLIWLKSHPVRVSWQFPDSETDF
jgi:hypothetical protein